MPTDGDAADVVGVDDDGQTKQRFQRRVGGGSSRGGCRRVDGTVVDATWSRPVAVRQRRRRPVTWHSSIHLFCRRRCRSEVPSCLSQQETSNENINKLQDSFVCRVLRRTRVRFERLQIVLWRSARRTAMIYVSACNGASVSYMRLCVERQRVCASRQRAGMMLLLLYAVNSNFAVPRWALPSLAPVPRRRADS